MCAAAAAAADASPRSWPVRANGLVRRLLKLPPASRRFPEPSSELSELAKLEQELAAKVRRRAREACLGRPPPRTIG